ncbi:MAG TPA: Crp/Fnr family transcriptional regulator [Candidatus Acetatifactor stercoripullorum]|uniref:Crp/Fnr family transcriptional regulator n=1 Tax=Candidatus Acetatifactor stercoripullorum TaxID=2838414 RepID=A0A9D1R598_9FIRM|nr:Crp/Fnr family transcriptional regulator [uncultured Acetatifactor sp.]HIW80321.1 Crp/Fnr family transcriptional regulator [Candidatus Acetatifactor stercoripullorum]
MKNSLLSNTALFRGVHQKETDSLLSCLQAYEKSYEKNQVILHAGDMVDSLGMVLEGTVLIEADDIWGNRSILDKAECGQIFAETYALLPGEPLMVNVTAACCCRILFLNVRKLTQTCSASCPFHHKMIGNLLSLSAEKNLKLSRRIFHTSSKSIRGRLISYFSQQVRQNGSYQFTIPFNRKQLADYLGVDRSALSNELSKMQKEGILSYEKNTFRMIP